MPFILEYYDLPYKYNKTVIKALAQNPNTLFVYWEISDEDIHNLKENYGDKKVLIVTHAGIIYAVQVALGLEINPINNLEILEVSID